MIIRYHAHSVLSAGLATLLLCLAGSLTKAQDRLPNTEPLTWTDDIAVRIVTGADSFLLKQLQQSVAARSKHWQRDFSSAEAYDKSISTNRARLRDILGLRDTRAKIAALQLQATTQTPALVAANDLIKIYAVRWQAVRGIHGDGLLLVPRKIQANVVAIPDADQTPEMICGLVPGVSPEQQYARHLAQAGCRVLVPTLIDRKLAPRNRRAQLSSREFAYRSAYMLGRHVIGYELHKVFTGIDWLTTNETDKAPDDKKLPLGVIGYGEGGMLALYAGALDPRIHSTFVSGYFSPREGMWDEPISRNVFGLLEQFGAAELATMVTPRKLIAEACQMPKVDLPGRGGAPGKITTPKLAVIEQEWQRAQTLLSSQPGDWPKHQLLPSGDGTGPHTTLKNLGSFLDSLGGLKLAAEPTKPPAYRREGFDPAQRQASQLAEMDQHNQWALRESPFVRQRFMSKLDKSSLSSYAKSAEVYRDKFRNEVIGHYDISLSPPKPRSRKAYEGETWTGYEVVLDVFPDVVAFGVLLVPKGIKPNEKRPVVVCQHGLEGRPKDVISGDHRAYHDYAAKLAERGFITFAPQNLYIFRDRFRSLQRKSYLLKKTLFSLIVPQHQQICNWLKTLPYVDEKRIAFYGLSYGGKSAMRIPPLVTDYCLSICSADFNEWVRKNASTRHNFSYVWTGEYEIFEWDLGSTFNYAEMAALICPRPFMVERGHFDGVGKDEWVAYEFAKVRHLYAAQLFIPDRCQIEWFYGQYRGVHTINGRGTFDFLHKHLNWPKP